MASAGQPPGFSPCTTETVKRRSKILGDHVDMVVLSSKDDTLIHGLSLLSTIESLPPSDTEKPGRTPGAISEFDLRRFNADFSYMNSATREALARELDTTLTSIAEYLYGVLDATHSVSTVEGDITSLQSSLKADELGTICLQEQIQVLATEIISASPFLLPFVSIDTHPPQIHPRLSSCLSEALSTYPSSLNKTRASAYDLLATSIETSLLKLSLIRTQAHTALYGSKSSSTPQITDALVNMSDSLSLKEQALDDENEKLDKELAEYEATLRIVGGGFGQIVDDWITVKRDSDACRKDLRRLGWTGD